MNDLERISVLGPIYGNEVELVGDSGSTEVFRIVAEFRLDGQGYAGLQTAAMRKEDEVAFFRIVTQEGGEPELESIDDEDEWEAASEAFDDLMFAGDEQP
ncbi:uncharacterized protein YrzB (UPF0473 family) [Paenibacillus phyllosphaerae]|uniref:Uncharacterized protein YrzB (UPF0473 family) n=1 Tax=Paenibacillus phyllosphaerae TaxID=274593 RepID=A0A7W5AWH3_9BACL|nr:DUF1292 domain-containing protein [Paenibacillus phyllosphaerae]MBB3109957.1 uncharacterized protein YrzB (UPF0473 family) [Paenibacillus phyllosphaerae]